MKNVDNFETELFRFETCKITGNVHVYNSVCGSTCSHELSNFCLNLIVILDEKFNLVNVYIWYISMSLKFHFTISQCFNSIYGYKLINLRLRNTEKLCNSVCPCH